MDVQDLIRRVSRHFFDLVDDDANPLVVALALQDNSSVGLQYYADEFAQLREELRASLKARVDENYQGFNESVGVYRHAGGALKASHDGVIDVARQLADLQALVRARKEPLGELHQQSVALKRRLELLADLEELHAFPAKFEALLARKRFADAHALLAHALEVVNARDLLRQRRLRPLLAHIRRQQLLLVDRLADESRAHIYLRTPSAARLHSESADYALFADQFDALIAESAARPLDPAGNYFVYLVQLLQNLANAQGLEGLLDSLAASAPDEVRAAVRTVARSVARELKARPAQLPAGDTMQQFRRIDHAALDTLARAVSARLLGVLQCHAAVARAAPALGLTYSLNAVCAAVTAALSQFLLKYVGDTVLRSRAHPEQRPKSAQAFQFTAHEEDARGLRDFQALNESVSRSVPGQLPADPNNAFVEVGAHEDLEDVVPAHVLNMRTLLEPTAALLERCTTIVPDALRPSFELFLDAFMRKSFVPRLQRALETDIDAVRHDPASASELVDWSTLSKLPLMRAAARFAELVGAAARLLDAGRRAREEYTRIVLHLLRMCTEYFVAQTSSAFLVSAQKHALVWNLAVDQRHMLALQQRYAGKPSTKEFEVYFAKRTTPFSAKSLLTIADLLDIGIYKRTALLITSLRWFAHWLRKARRVVPVQEASTSALAESLSRWNLLDPGPDGSSAFAAVALADKPLADYDQLIDNLEACVFRALCALRSDIFLRVVYYFDQMITSNDFHEGGRGDKRDPIVDRIQRELSLISQVTETHLVNSDHEFLLGGIAQFMNELFILEGDNIVDMDEAGQNQILTNIFAFQQMSTSFVSDPREVDFSRATWFYELFRLTPTLIIERVRLGETCLGKEDLAMLLQIRHRNAANSSSVSSHSFGTLQFHLTQLDEIFNAKRSRSQASIHSLPAQSSAQLVPATRQHSQPAEGSPPSDEQLTTHHSHSKSQGQMPSAPGVSNSLNSAAPPLPSRNSLPVERVRSPAALASSRPTSRPTSRPVSQISQRSGSLNPPPLPPKSPPRSPRSSSSHARAPSNPLTVAQAVPPTMPKSRPAYDSKSRKSGLED